MTANIILRCSIILSIKCVMKRPEAGFLVLGIYDKSNPDWIITLSQAIILVSLSGEFGINLWSITINNITFGHPLKISSNPNYVLWLCFLVFAFVGCWSSSGVFCNSVYVFQLSMNKCFMQFNKLIQW